MSEPIQSISDDDLIVWPDGTTCFRSELPEFIYMSDDFEVVPVDCLRWFELTQAGQ